MDATIVRIPSRDRRWRNCEWDIDGSSGLFSRGSLPCLEQGETRGLGCVGCPNGGLFFDRDTCVCGQGSRTVGLGMQALRLVPVDDEYRIDVQALKKMIQEDRQQGFTPFCIVGNAGMQSELTSWEMNRIYVGLLLSTVLSTMRVQKSSGISRVGTNGQLSSAQKCIVKRLF
ncbi:unnamed protein product [Sphagnum troendelagicum]|uniref:Uncharacterized protein n=1 Tax=Sphagnum troendelagicum TaxID=128251 RepID=A0ABP0T755_9BRYO